MKVDAAGNVYCGDWGDLEPAPAGKKLGRIVHSAPATNKLAFGGADWMILYFANRNHLGAVQLKIPGIPIPAKKPSHPSCARVAGPPIASSF